MTQVELDKTILAMASLGIVYAETTCDFNKRTDPDVIRRKEEYIMLRNIIYALQDYDVTAGIITNEQIDYLCELATLILEKCPNIGPRYNYIKHTSVPPVQTCDIFFISNDKKIYSYRPLDKLLSLRYEYSAYNVSADIANNNGKLWIINLQTGNNAFIEFDIIASPFSIRYNRSIRFNLLPGSGLSVKDDHTLIGTYESELILYDISGVDVNETILFNLGVNRYVTGDIIYNSISDTYIIANHQAGDGVRYFITEYASNGDVIAEIEITDLCTEIDSFVYGLFQYENDLYAILVESQTYIYKITIDGLVLDNTLPDVIIYGASQNVSCITANIPVPESNLVTITTNHIGNFTMRLAGTGEVSIDFDDGSELVTYILTGSLHDFVRNYTTPNHIIKIHHGDRITKIEAGSMHITDILGLTQAIDLTDIYLPLNQLTSFSTTADWLNITNINILFNSLYSFTTYAEWINLKQLNLYRNQLSTIETFAEWTLLEFLNISYNSIGNLTTYVTWVKLAYLYCGSCGLNSLTVYSEWTSLNTLDCSVNNLTTIQTFAEWINLYYLSVGSNQLTEITLREEWTKLNTIDISVNQISSINTFASWSKIYILAFTRNPLTSINYFTTWLMVYAFLAEYANLTESSVNNILINADLCLHNPYGIYLTYGISSAPTGAGLTAKTSLISKGIIVNTN